MLFGSEPFEYLIGELKMATLFSQVRARRALARPYAGLAEPCAGLAGPYAGLGPGPGLVVGAWGVGREAGGWGVGREA